MRPRYPVNTSLALASSGMRIGAKDLQGQKDPPNQSGLRQKGMRERETDVLHLIYSFNGGRTLMGPL